MTKKTYTVEIGGRPISIRIPGLAGQASGEAWVECGGTVVLVTAVINQKPRPDAGFFPLTVEYEERYYAAGVIRGSRFMKREARPSDEAILSARLTDRTIRPRFPRGMRNDVQIVITVLSFDNENDPDILGMLGASVALATSPIPWNGPVAGVRVGLHNGNFVINPTYAERETLDLEVVVAGTQGMINMIEGGGREAEERNVLEAVDAAVPEIQKLIALEQEIAQDINPVKVVPALDEPNDSQKHESRRFLGKKVEEALFGNPDKQNRMEAVELLKGELAAHLDANPELAETNRFVSQLIEDEIDRAVHEKAIHEERRVDGRALNEIRPLSLEVGSLPRTHGSALFTRGTTTSLCALTLGAHGAEQKIEMMEGQFSKRFMLHYNFPPFSVGETGPFRGPGRRDIGHGRLAERSVAPLLPSQEDFPYTIRIVSEILSSNGSSSMASVCGASLALMDGGVPISRPAAGIAMGLMSDGKDNWRVLTDIQGPEDHHGDMDLKIAGTRQGITGMQMDVKIEGITPGILEAVLLQAREARLQILDAMEAVLAGPRENLSPFAPRVCVIRINPERIRDVIGSGGKIINAIIAGTESEIDIEEDGRIFITAKSDENVQKAVAWIERLTREVTAGEIFEGTATRLFPFGVMVEVLPDKEGLVHISEFNVPMGGRLDRLVRTGDTLPVVVKEIDEQGRINLALQDPAKQEYAKKSAALFSDSFGGGRPPRSHEPRPQQRRPFRKPTGF